MSGKTFISYEVRTYKLVEDHKAITKEMVSEWLRQGRDIKGEILGIPFAIIHPRLFSSFQFIAGEHWEHQHFVDAEDSYEKAAEEMFEHMKAAFPGL
jgi:hypothetical protein